MGRVAYLVGMAVVLGLAVRAFIVERIVIASASMEPTLEVGRQLFVNKAAYRFGAPRRGDIVVFRSPVEPKGLVKRVIAVAGDEVRIENKTVWVNGRALEEPYAVQTRPEILVGDNLNVGTVPAGHVFVLGDNRDHSEDSRDWVDSAGAPVRFVAVSEIRGRLSAGP